MKGLTLIDGLREEDFMTLRWYTDVNTIYNRKTKEYVIKNNRGDYIGELIKNDIGNTYKIVSCRSHLIPSLKDLIKLKEVTKLIVDKQLTSPELKPRKDFSSPYMNHYLKKIA